MDIDIEFKEHEIRNDINIEDIEIDLVNLEESMKISSMKAKKLFTNIKQLKSCCEYSYTGIEDEELDYIIQRLSEINSNYSLKVDELRRLFDIIRKYMHNIQKTTHKKEIYKANIKNVLDLMKENVNDIKTFEPEEVEIGHLYNYEIDQIRELKKEIQRDYQNDINCKEVRQVRKLIEKYYKVICERLDYYTNELRKTNDKSKDYSNILNKVYEYRLLYKKLILYIKHYKIVNKECIIACESKGANLTHLYDFLDKLERCLRERIEYTYKFIENAK